jgi:hypothetical protein
LSSSTAATPAVQASGEKSKSILPLAAGGAAAALVLLILVVWLVRRSFHAKV